MEVFAQVNTRLRFRLPGVVMAIFLLLTAIPSIAAADDNGTFTSSGQVMTINGPALHSDPPFNESVAAVAIPAAIKRGFYLTKDGHMGNAALTACSAGYHMASIWELLDVSSLNYHYKHPNAYKRDDSGNGPPAGQLGWVRTGYTSSGEFNTLGTANCENWTSNSGSRYGSCVTLQDDWLAAVGPLGPWRGLGTTCNSSYFGVWCVSNVK